MTASASPPNSPVYRLPSSTTTASLLNFTRASHPNYYLSDSQSMEDLSLGLHLSLSPSLCICCVFEEGAYSEWISSSASAADERGTMNATLFRINNKPAGSSSWTEYSNLPPGEEEEPTSKAWALSLCSSLHLSTHQFILNVICRLLI